MIFIDGSIENPKTPSSAKLAEAVCLAGVRNFKVVDLTKEAKVAQWLPAYSNRGSTDALVFLNGSLLGNSDEVSALISSNKLDELLPKENRKQTPAEEWATIRSSFDIVLLVGDLTSATSLQTILKSSSVDYL